MRRLALLPLLIALGGFVPADADVASSRSGGLGTRVNGALGGRCSSGVCRIDGAVLAAATAFIGSVSSIPAERFKESRSIAMACAIWCWG